MCRIWQNLEGLLITTNSTKDNLFLSEAIPFKQPLQIVCNLTKFGNEFLFLSDSTDRHVYEFKKQNKKFKKPATHAFH